MGKTFNNLNKSKCKDACNYAIRNSEDHYEVAEIVYNSHKYGFGISHLIIANEEIVKGFILYLDSVGFNFRQVKGLEAVFKNHQLRYLLSYFLFTINSILDEINLWLSNTNDHKNLLELISEFLKKLTCKDQETRNSALSIILKNLEFLFRETKSFRNFDIERQEGNYIDFDDDFHTPQNKTAYDYLIIKERVLKVRDAINQLIYNLNLGIQEDPMFLNEIIKALKKENIYNEIEQFLRNTKLENIDPLTYISGKIESIIVNVKMIMDLKELNYPEFGKYSIINNP